jgi:hypothetical protein
MTEREQVPLTPEYVDAVLSAVENRGVLVGGQALAVWVSIFDLDIHRSGSAPISIDADFLGDRGLVEQIHNNIPGSTAKLQLRSAISSLIGVVEIPLPDDKFMAIDVIDMVPPLTEEHVFKRAVPLSTPDGKRFLVLHPMDLLTSRAYNLRNFKEKQNANGIEQLQMSLRVVFTYLSSALTDGGKQRQVLKIIEEIARLAKGPSGATAKAYGIDFLTAMPLELIDNEAFQTIRRPQLQKELDDVKPPAYLKHSTSGIAASGVPGD